jgi:hypothetical protein
MYMRYAGGGVGHYRVDLPEEPVDEDTIPEEPEDMDQLTTPLANIAATGDEGSDSEGSGKSSVEGSDDEEREESGDEPELGPEDGEGGFIDEEDEEGYAPL